MNHYSDHASELFIFYQGADPAQVHDCWIDLLPNAASLACDIGAGSGRDAAWLANKGWDVIAVEPAHELRKLGEQFTLTQPRENGSISWIDDQLPELNRLRSQGQRFQLVLISAVWMHLQPSEHQHAMRNVSELLAPAGLLVISLRHGPDDAGRFHPFTTDEIIALAQHRGLTVTRDIRGIADKSRELVSWDYLVFNAPTSETKQTTT
ncbi:MAG: methyltransferase type 11 [Gammaproteobacteria bacterium]|nr:methyltransferase type 11 [Gammaproteobacteria bacterium]|tara:strand:+ start:1577 stop:2200 length:624 start_codon:yes stop_codon:yes gene_type:complete